MIDQNTEKAQSRRYSILRYAPLLLIALALVAFFAAGLNRYLSFETLQAHHEQLRALVTAHPVASAGIFIALYAAITAASVPGASLLTIAGGFLFGTLVGSGLAVTGATIGATLVYLAARTAFGDVLREKLPGSALERLSEGFAANAFSYLLSLRLIPMIPFWLINLAPAFLGVGLRTFTLATAIGIIPGTIVYAGVGGGLGVTLAKDQELNLDLFSDPRIFLPLVGLGLLSLVPILWRYFKARRSKLANM